MSLVAFSAQHRRHDLEDAPPDRSHTPFAGSKRLMLTREALNYSDVYKRST